VESSDGVVFHYYLCSYIFWEFFVRKVSGNGRTANSGGSSHHVTDNACASFHHVNQLQDLHEECDFGQSEVNKLFTESQPILQEDWIPGSTPLFPIDRVISPTGETSDAL